MRYILAVSIILLAANLSFGQYAQAPITEKEIIYKDWTYKNIRSGEDQNLREYAIGKKLVIVVYFAPWCHDWAYDAPLLQQLYEKYKGDGLGMIAVGLYDPVEAMKTNLGNLKITFPAVYESAERDARQKSLHFEYRKSTNDDRKWGSPWYVFLTPSMMEKNGDILTKKTFVINGEMIMSEGERFIRSKLGLPPSNTKLVPSGTGKIEVCDPVKP